MSEQNLAHLVFFTLKDGSTESINTVIEACRKYLDNHPGIVHFSVGPNVPDLQRPVNDQDYHVNLNVIFESRAAHDAYQTDERHLQFIAETKESWENVRIFDSYVS